MHIKKRGLFKGKRAGVDPGHHVIMILFELMLAVMVIVAMLSYVDSVRKNTLFEKSFLSKDLAMVASALSAAPGTVSYQYMIPEYDISQYIFSFEDNKASVVEVPVGGKKGITTYYPFISDNNIDVRGDMLLSPAGISFVRSGSSLTVGKASIPLGMECLYIPTRDDDWMNYRIVVDPGHGGKPGISFGGVMDGDLGYVNNDDPSIYEAEAMRLIAHSLSTKISNGLYTRKLDEQEYKTLADRASYLNEPDAGIIISIHAGSYNFKKLNPAVAYYSIDSLSSHESRKLACLILNSLVSEISEISSIKIEPVSFYGKVPDSSYNMLDTDKPAVLLEIGNMDAEKQSNILVKNTNKIADAIANAIQAYYKDERI